MNFAQRKIAPVSTRRGRQSCIQLTRCSRHYATQQHAGFVHRSADSVVLKHPLHQLKHAQVIIPFLSFRCRNKVSAASATSLIPVLLPHFWNRRRMTTVARSLGFLQLNMFPNNLNNWAKKS
jgi:hypothetical protein